jgi:hypothetical protein
MAGSLTLLPGEEVCLESNKVSLQLTNLRVCHRYTLFPDPQFDSITLDAVASTGLRTFSRPLLLVIAAILILSAINLNSDLSGSLYFFGFALIVAYFVTRRRKIVVESSGGFLMRIPAGDLSIDECYFMIHAIDRAKMEFLQKVPKQP